MKDPPLLAPYDRPTLSEAFAAWLRVAALSFGGPAGQIATMHRIAVVEEQWLDDERFLHALSYCAVLPGPEAQQLAIYIGWLTHGTRGGLIAGTLFILPGLLAIMALSYLYAFWGELAPVAALLLGLKSAVLAVVLQSVQRLGARSVNTRRLATISVAAFGAIFFFAVPFPLIVLAAGLAGWAGAALPSAAPQSSRAGSPFDKPATRLGEPRGSSNPTTGRVARTAATWLALWLLPLAAVLAASGKGGIFGEIALFFSKAALIGFGGAYAVLAYVAQQSVGHFHWLRPGEMLDGLGLAETTPGPLIMVTQFVGFMAAYRHPGAMPPWLAGTLGGLLTTWMTFTPCFLWVFTGAPFVEKLRGNTALTGALTAITAAVVGVILNLAIWFALHTWFTAATPLRGYGLSFDAPVLSSVNPLALALSAAAAVALFRFGIGMIPTMAGCAAAALALHMIA